MTERNLRVLDAGPLTTIQDAGRLGLAHLGVPRAGALDPIAAGLANRLVGNTAAGITGQPRAPGPVGTAVLETTMGGMTFTLSRATTIAVTGAPSAVHVDGRPVAFAAAVTVPAGATVRVGPAEAGVRCYVAVAGGIDVPPVLASRSTDTLAWVGPPRVRDGQVLQIGPPQGEPVSAEEMPARSVGGAVTLPVDLGPRADWFTAEARERFTGSGYVVDAQSNRIGLRLHGPPLDRAVPEELPSEGLVLGAVQVPASGQPVVFLNDHPTTGGYPVIAVVAAEALPKCAQLRPGDEVRFTRR